MAENKLHSALFGYKKEDVHEYIQLMSENASNEIKKYLDDLQAFKNETANLKEKNNADIAKKDQEISDLKALLSKKQKEVEDIQVDFNKLKNENEELNKTIKDFDKERSAISKALIVAQNNAGNIISEAKDQADSIMQKLNIDKEEQMRIAAIDMENAKKEIGKTTSELVSLKEQAISALQKYTSELEYILSEYKV